MLVFGAKLKKNWQADHFHPVIRVDGKPLYPELDTEQNLVPSCAPCNNFKSSSNIEGFRWTINEQFTNTLKNSTGLRQLNRLGLVDIERKPITFWFEKQGLNMPSEESFYGISEEAKNTIWEYDDIEQCHVKTINQRMVTARKIPNGLLVISTGKDWHQLRTEIKGSKHNLARAAEWALRINE